MGKTSGQPVSEPRLADAETNRPAISGVMGDDKSDSIARPHNGFQKRPSKRVIGDVVSIVDLLIIILAALIARLIYIELYLDSDQHVDPYLLMGAVGAVVAVMVFRNQGLYAFDRLRIFRGQTRRIAMGLGVAALVLLTISYFLKVSQEFSRGWMLTWFMSTAISLPIWHFVVARRLQRWMSSGIFTHNIVVYGSSEIAEQLIAHLTLESGAIHLKGVFDDLQRNEVPRVLVAGGLSDLIRAGQDGNIDEILIALPMADGQRITGLVNQLSILPVNIRLCPDLAAFRLRPLGIIDYQGVPMLELARRPLDDWAPIVKSIEDRVLAALLLAGLLPVGLLIAVFIRLTSPGPVFFRQRRHGFNHQIIKIWKFRTMHVEQDGGVIPQATRYDPRITPLGRFLRRTSLDELPQLINVIKGEMSLVGPRPHALAHNEYYAALVERYANRHKMKPGITGWAQINGYRGETDTPEKMRKRIELDLYYIENWSIWFDLKIILLTPFLGLWGRNAF